MWRRELTSLVAARAGLSHTPLGFTAVAALERWVKSYADDIRPHFPAILPILGEYLSAGM